VAARAHWNGFLNLSLVSCPIALYPAIAAAERVSFRQVNKATGHRLRQALVDSVTGEPVRSGDKGRGYEVGENRFLLVEDEELRAAEQEARSRPFGMLPAQSAVQPQARSPEAAPAAAFAAPARPEPATARGSARDARAQAGPAEPPAPQAPAPADHALPAPAPIENNRTIAIDRFVPRAQIDARYLLTPYYIVPRDEIGEEAFAVIRDAMRDKEVVGMGRVVLARRERPIIVETMGAGVLGTTLRFAHEIRNAAEHFAGIAPLLLPAEMRRLAEHLVETKTEDFDPVFLEDRYRTVLIAKRKEKQRELPGKAAAPVPPPRQNVIDLMEVLRRSLAAEGPARRVPVARGVRRSSKGAQSRRASMRRRG
jgi:DNA end-binding protein Ku